MAKKNEKWIEYAALISAQVQEMFTDDNDNYINPDDFQDSENFKQFLFALSTVIPAKMYNTLTKDAKNFLEFNHISNHLVFEYSNKAK